MKTTISRYFEFETSNKHILFGYDGSTVQLNKCYVKWSTNAIRKEKAMLHNSIHINLKTWIQLAKTNTKLAKKINTTSSLCIKFILDDLCPFSLWPFRFVAVQVCGRFGLWPFRLWPFRFVAVMTRNRDGNPPVTGGSITNSMQWRGALFSLICAWTNGWGNNRNAADLRRFRAHYDVTVMPSCHDGSQLTCSGNDNTQRLEETSGTWWRPLRCPNLAKYGFVGLVSIWKISTNMYDKWNKLSWYIIFEKYLSFNRRINCSIL